MNLLILATTRFTGDPPAGADSKLKALLRLPTGDTLLSRTVTAAEEMSGMDRLVVVGAPEVEPVVNDHPGLTYLPEGDSDYESLLRGILGCADSERTLVCAAHLADVDAAALQNLLSNAPEDAAVSLPVYTRAAFKEHYPSVRTVYVKLADGEFTVPPAVVVQGAALIRAEPVVRKLFEARGNPMSLAGMLGFGIVARFLAGRLTSEDVRRKAQTLLKCQCTLLRTCSPKLALSVTTSQSWDDIRALG